MGRLQIYVSNNVIEQINDLVTQRKQEGTEDATVSNIASMLLELGLRVYNLQREKKEGGFNQMEYNKIMLDNLARVRAMCTEVMKMNALGQEVLANGDFDIEVMKQGVARFAAEQTGIFFLDDETTA